MKVNSNQKDLQIGIHIRDNTSTTEEEIGGPCHQLIKAIGLVHKICLLNGAAPLHLAALLHGDNSGAGQEYHQVGSLSIGATRETD